MTSTYDKIASTTLVTGQSSVTLSSIPATYTDLVYVFNGAGSTDINIYMQFNGDTATNYSSTYIGGNGTTVVSARATSAAHILINAQSYMQTGFTTNALININNYSNATTYKTSINRFNNGSNGTDAVVGLWRNTNAITSILLKPHTGTFSTGSTFTLYGIKAE